MTDDWPGHIAFAASVFGDSGAPLSWLQMSARAVVAFVYGVALIRVAGTRVFGKGAAFDIILSVIIGSNLSRALTGNAPLWETLITTSVLVLLHWLTAEFAFRNKAFATLVKGNPRVLVKDGKRIEKALRREEIGRRDLEAAMRAQDIARVEEIGLAVLERNGAITLTRRDASERDGTDEG